MHFLRKVGGGLRQLAARKCMKIRFWILENEEMEQLFAVLSKSFSPRTKIFSAFVRVIVKHPTRLISLETIDNPFWINAMKALIRTLFYACTHAPKRGILTVKQANRMKTELIPQNKCCVLLRFQNTTAVAPYLICKRSLCVCTCSVLYCMCVDKAFESFFVYKSYSNVFLERTSHVENLLH